MKKLGLRLGLLLLLTQCAAAQTEYTADGVPTAKAEEFRWHLNRGRSNPAAENALRGTAYADVPTIRGPLAMHASLLTAARNHAEDLATKNVFYHETVPNSAFYNQPAHAATQRKDFFDRAIDSGYQPNSGNENITAGTAQDTALEVYLSWWNSSSGHRPGMYGDFREMGEGSFYRPASDYDYYDALTVASRNAATAFFTGSLFQDSNADGVYTIGEGRSGIRVELAVNGVTHTIFDVSSAAGSFAVPTDDIAAGSVVQVYLTGPAGATTNLSIPQDFHTLRTLTLSGGQRWLLGTFTRAANTNAGFRNLTFNNATPISVPQVSISRATGQTVVSWPSQTGLTYQVQWSSNLAPPWTNLHSPALAGTGGILSRTDATSTSATPRRFYKVVVTGP